MKFVILAAIVATAAARPSAVLAPLVYAAPAFATSNQYHAQDTLGQYNYGYSNILSSKAEAKSINGITAGGYSYVDAEGKLQSVQYTADAANGFRVAATNLPVAPAIPKVEPLPQPIPVEDTPEVAAAKAKHLVALEEAKVKAAAVPVSVPVAAASPVLTYAYGIHAPVISTYAYPNVAAYSYAAPWAPATYVVDTGVAPVAPSETPEVAQARAQHLAAVEEVKARN